MCYVYIEHVTPINRSFYSGYEVVGKDLSVCELFDICCLKHKYCMTLLLGTLQRFNGHPRIVATPFRLLKVMVAVAINW